MGVGILAKRVVLELGSSTNFVYSLNFPTVFLLWGNSDCRQSPRFTPGLFYCSYQHFNDSSGFYQEKSPTYQLES